MTQNAWSCGFVAVRMGRGGATVAREARNHADNAAVPHGRRGLQGGGGPRAVGSSLAFPRHVCVPRRDPHECFLPLSPGRPERPVCLSFPHPLPLNAILRRSIRPCLCSLPRFAPRACARACPYLADAEAQLGLRPIRHTLKFSARHSCCYY